MRYIFDERIGKWVPRVAHDEPRNSDALLWNDRDYQDMNDPRFASRTQHREYMKANNLTTADDYREQWAKQERERGDYFGGRDSERRDDVRRSLEKMARG